jgi:hypothetical protein
MAPITQPAAKFVPLDASKIASAPAVDSADVNANRSLVGDVYGQVVRFEEALAKTVADTQKHAADPHLTDPGKLFATAKGFAPIAIAAGEKLGPVLAEGLKKIAGFLAERCSLNPLAKTPASELYAAYREWCNRTGERIESQRWFGLRLGERPGLSKRKTKTSVVWHGLRMVDEVDDKGRVSVTPPLETPYRDHKGNKVHQGASSTWESEDSAA